MRIVILTSHLLESDKKVNIHYIYEGLVNDGHSVCWITYPLSVSIFRKRNRYKLKALIKGFFRQLHVISLIPPYAIRNIFFRNIFSIPIYFFSTKRLSFDLMISEGYQSAYFFEKIKFRKLIYRMSDDEGYLNFFSDESEQLAKMINKTNQVWSVLLSSSRKYKNSIYLPNPSYFSEVYSRKEKLKEAVYVGSNKFDNNFLRQLLDSGIVINLFSEKIPFFHENLIFHGLVNKSDLQKQLSLFKVGLIPFDIDQKNTHMEIPLKTYDYLSAGLHVVMLSSSTSIKTEVIHLTDDKENFIEKVKRLMNEDIDFDKYNEFLKLNSMEKFFQKINNNLREIF